MPSITFTNVIFFAIWCCGYFSLELFWIFIGILLAIYQVKISAAFNRRQLFQTQNNIQAAKQLSWLNSLNTEEDWFNKVIQLLWPNIANYLKRVIEDQLEPLIKQSSGLLSNLTISDINLGTVAPKFQIVGVHEDLTLPDKEILIDANIVYHSDCRIEVKANRLTAGICDLTVQGVLRISLCCLSDEKPLIGAITISFVNDPIITYDLTQLANLFDLPGVDKVFQYAVSQSIKSLVVLPKKVAFRFEPNVDLDLIKFPLPKGVLHIQVIGAHNLKQKRGQKNRFLAKKMAAFRTDPYVVIKVGSFESRTKAIPDSVHPMWNEAFSFFVYDIVTAQVEFSIYDDSGPLKKDSCLGSVLLPIDAAYNRGLVDQLIPLSSSDNSKLHVRLEWFDLSTSIYDLPEARRLLNKNGLQYTAMLSIFTLGASNLPVDNPNNATVLSIGLPNQKALKTKSSKGPRPVWRECFHVFVANPEEHTVLFEVNNLAKKACIGKRLYLTSNLLEAPDMNLNQLLGLEESQTEAVLKVRLKLRILKSREDRIVAHVPSKVFLTSSYTSVVSSATPSQSV